MPAVRTLVLCAMSIAAFSYRSIALADDPPARVGRVSYLEGTVSFQAGDAPWAYAILNYPVQGGSVFWTEPDGRGEIQIGSVEIRMDHSTELQVLKVDETATQLQVLQGVVNIHFSAPPIDGNVEVSTPLGAVKLSQPGTYHIDSGQPTGETPSDRVQLTALEGEMSIQGPRSRLEAMPGETVILAGNPPTYTLQEGNATPFDDWALMRERREESHSTAQYVSPHTTGYEDLDTYGQWSADPQYGAVWYPAAVGSGWAPYRDGRWVYVTPWGWTWVDNAPWGFAPFHYGRWAYLHERWGWVPGEIATRPVYAPALVAFIGGWNPAFGRDRHASSVGWVPLAPYEVFHPYYPVSEPYLRNVNRSNVERVRVDSLTVNNIRNVSKASYANQRATTIVPAPVFAQSKPVRHSAITAPQAQLARVPLAPALEPIVSAPAARGEEMSLRTAGLPGLRSGHTQPDRPVGVNASAAQAVTVPPVKRPEIPRAPLAPVIAEVRLARTEEGREITAALPLRERDRRSTPLIAYVTPAVQIPRPSPRGLIANPQIRMSATPSARADVTINSVSAMEMRHPQQHTHIEPMQRGWQRTAEHQQPPHGAVNHPAERGPNEPRKPRNGQ